MKVIAAAGYVPIRVMFYYPNRQQAIRIQETLETLYGGMGGQYYYGRIRMGIVRLRPESI